LECWNIEKKGPENEEIPTMGIPEDSVKITLEFLGLPNLSKKIGKKINVEFTGETISDLTSHLVRRYGPKARQMLLDSDGQLDPTIQVMINDDGFVPRHQLSEKTFKENDTVRFMLLAGGG